jgi:hypothetical protein
VVRVCPVASTMVAARSGTRSPMWIFATRPFSTRILGLARVFASTSCLKKRKVTGGMVRVAVFENESRIEPRIGSGLGAASVNA